MEQQTSLRKYPTIHITPDNRSNLFLQGGPSLNTRSSRAEITIAGEIINFEIIGDGKDQNNDFQRILQTTRTYVFEPKCGYIDLNTAQFITFEYNLTFATVTYDDPRLFVKIVKKILPAPDAIAGYAIEITLHEKGGMPLPGTYHVAMQSIFSLGDNYLNSGMFVFGWAVQNAMNSHLFGTFASIPTPSEAPLVYMQTRVSTWDWIVRSRKTPIIENAVEKKRNEETCFIIQRGFTLTRNEFPPMLFTIGGGKTSTDAGMVLEDFMEKWEGGAFEQYARSLQDDAERFFFLHTPDPLLNQYAAVSAKTAATYYMLNKKAFTVPGHQYPRFYARDSYWQFRGMLILGMASEVKDLIGQFFNEQRENGAFATSLNLDGTLNQFTASGADLDGVILPVLSLIEYVRWSQDWATAKQFWPKIVKSHQYLLTRDTDGDGFLEQKGNQDWADTLQRSGKVVYSQAIYYEFLHAIESLAQKFGDARIAKECKRIYSKMESNFDAIFWDEPAGTYVDFVKPDGTKKVCANQDMLLARIFGLNSNRVFFLRSLDRLKKNCWTEWGAGKQEPYDLEGSSWGLAGFYHNGGIWLWCAAFEATARFLAGQIDDGLWILNTCRAYDFGKNPYGYCYLEPTEWYGTYTGENDYHHYKSAKFFTTGAGAHLWALIHGLLGLKLGFDGNPQFSPRFPEAWDGKKTELDLTVGGNRRHFSLP